MKTAKKMLTKMKIQNLLRILVTFLFTKIYARNLKSCCVNIIDFFVEELVK